MDIPAAPVNPAAGQGMVRMIVRPSSVPIPPGSPRRTAPRPSHLRPPDYADKFDDDTLFFDVFREGGRVVAVGPPLVNLVDELPGWTFAADGMPLRRPSITTLDRSHRMRFDVPQSAGSLSLSTASETVAVPIGANLSSAFAGTRALMTLQLDTDLDWVSDWVRWHVNAQGTDAVVMYDNGSTRYPLTDLLESISLPGIRSAAVVDWSFRYGPQGSDELPWDSDFTQYGAIEHARRRFLGQAAGMLSIDIDELVYAKGGRTVYECAERSPEGFVLFEGTWAYTDPAWSAGRPRHADCTWTRPGDEATASKWCAIPARLPARSQLIVHSAHGVSMPHPPIAYWHLRPISTHWKVDRSRSEHDAGAYRHSALLAEQMQRYLADDGTPAPRPRDVPPSWLGRQLRRAGSLARRLRRRLPRRSR